MPLVARLFGFTLAPTIIPIGMGGGPAGRVDRAPLRHGGCRHLHVPRFAPVG